MITLPCEYDGPDHTYPDDWQFGGPRNRDPRADPRWRGDIYVYLDDHFNEVWATQVPLCDDEALDRFSDHADVGAMYLQVIRCTGESDVLPWRYVAADDTFYPLEA